MRLAYREVQTYRVYPEDFDRMKNAIVRMSVREAVRTLILKGKTNGEIGHILNITPYLASVHRKRLLKAGHLNVHVS